MPNVFELAARRRYRFASPQGQLTTEQLFELPLTTTVANKASLDNVSRLVLAEARGAADSESLVTSATRDPNLDIRVEVVRQVIAFRQEELAAEQQRRDNRAQKAKILDAIEAAEGRELSTKSVADLRAELAKLDG